MVTIQRVRIRWGATSRGAAEANARRGLDRLFPLPGHLPDGDPVVHEVYAAEDTGYEPRSEIWSGDTERLRLRFTAQDGAVAVARLPILAAYPRHELPKRLFILRPGETGRYRANFRFRYTDCPCDPSWYYESWTVHIANGRHLHGVPDHDIDHRVHLYGGPARSRRHRVRRTAAS